MNTEETAGQALHSDDDAARSEAARLMGSVRSDRKAEAARVNQQRAAEARRGKPMTEEHRAKLRQSQTARWQRIKAEQAVMETDARPAVKTTGQSKTQRESEPVSSGGIVLKRGRGRPQEQQESQSGS